MEWSGGEGINAINIVRGKATSSDLINSEEEKNG
jgi:hypothetical protein